MTKKVKGLDVGTMYLAGATQEDSGKINIKMIRHTFLDIDANPFTQKMLKEHKVQYVEIDNKVYVLGDSAFELANVMNKTVRRPMQSGVLSADEADAVLILSLLIKAVIGKSEKDGMLCYFSVPAEPIDADFNIVYHLNIIAGALKNLGYTPCELNEGYAVVFSELADRDFTGIGISFGGGMVNVCVSYKTISAITFSTSRAGDWIDKNVAQVLGIKPNRATALKEKGIDMKNPTSREEEAVVIYYRNLINYTLTKIKEKFQTAEQIPQFPEPVDIVCAGGTSLIGGFIDIFEGELKKIDFPIAINKIRLAEEPLHATSRGCLLAALNDTQSKEQKKISA